MMEEFPRRLFVAGTDTDVGKTVISAILMAGLQGSYWKPIQSGLEETTDTEWVRLATGLPDIHFFPETCRLSRALSPHASAAVQGVRIDLPSFRLPETEDHLIVEGAGGILVPLNERDFMVDLIDYLNLPVLLVARSTLGTINHTLLSLEQLKVRGLTVLGVVMNGPANPGNREAIEYYGNTKVLAEIESLSKIEPPILKETFARHFQKFVRRPSIES
ncbi:MAG: dethiobiotin synthase [Syntrophales bacterium]|jgi:dethiobiotin synthetase|nr:dethiobiotin synthase [Syntrophales bacterium]MDY0044715.1 dethiobiotin synthase [Syntrophales bacterium]